MNRMDNGQLIMENADMYVISTIQRCAEVFFQKTGYYVSIGEAEKSLLELEIQFVRPHFTWSCDLNFDSLKE